MGKRGAREETSAGGVVVRCAPDGPRYLLIRDRHRNWGYPKGHLDPGESPEQAAVREIAEETGLHALSRHASLGTIDWRFRHRGQVVHKTCHFFLFSSRNGEPVPQRDEGISACAWLAYDEAIARLRYANARGLLERAAALATGLCPDAS